MDKRLIQAICYVAVAGAVGILSVSGIVPSFGKEEASVQTELSDSSTAAEAEGGQQMEQEDFGQADGTGAKTSDSAETGNSDSAGAGIEATDSDALENPTGTGIGTTESSGSENDSGEKKTKKKKTKKEKSETDKSETVESEKENADEGTDEKESESAVQKNGTYYTYRVTMSPDSLRIYASEEDGEAIGSVPSGYCGYVLQKTSGARSLILYKGKVGYCSNMYLEMTRIPAEEYPDELVGMGEDDIGTLQLGGNAAGPAEKQN